MVIEIIIINKLVMKSLIIKQNFNVDDIISYAELVAVEGINLQKGMNFQIKLQYSILLMSVRKKHLMQTNGI